MGRGCCAGLCSSPALGRRKASPRSGVSAQSLDRHRGAALRAACLHMLAQDHVSPVPAAQELSLGLFLAQPVALSGREACPRTGTCSNKAVCCSQGLCSQCFTPIIGGCSLVKKRKDEGLQLTTRFQFGIPFASGVSSPLPTCNMNKRQYQSHPE